MVTFSESLLLAGIHCSETRIFNSKKNDNEIKFFYNHYETIRDNSSNINSSR